MDKRVLLTVALSMVILFAWTKWFMPPPPPQPHPSTSAPANAPAANPPVASPAPAATANAAAPAAAKAKPPAEVQTIDRPGFYQAKLTSWGAAPSSWVLSNKQYQELITVDGKKLLRPINLVRTSPPELPLTTTFPESDFNVAADAAWTPLGQQEGDYVYTLDAGDAHLEKRYSFVPDSYEMRVKITVENRGDKPLREHLQLGMVGWQDPSAKPGGMFSPRTIRTSGMCDVNGKLKSGELQSLLKTPIDETGQVRWVGVDEKYFVAAAAIKPDPEGQRCNVTANVDGTITSTLLLAGRTIAPHGRTDYDVVAFFGPKILSKLDAVTIGGQDAKLGDAVNYGWTEAIARPMLAVLKAIHVAVPNWGWAIIVLTILLKAVTWWPTTKSMKSMKAMAKLKPEMDKIKEKYGNDKNRMNQEVMELYKKHGINPLGGCLPMLIQMPIYIALYAMLGNSVELYRSGFIGYIKDLTAPDPFFVLPILTGVLMFAQQKLSPTPPDPQQKAMAYMMPVMFTVFSMFLPAGLTVYILTNTLLSMLQQWMLNRQEPGRPQPTNVAGKPARAS